MRQIISRTVFLMLIGVLAAAVPSVSAQEFDLDAEKEVDTTRALTLEQAINIALANNSEIKRSMLDVEDADQDVRMAWGEILPEIETSASYTRNVEIPVNFVPAQFFDPEAPADELVPLAFGTDNNWTGGLTVTQTLFRGEAFVGISSSQLYKTAQAENLRATTQQIVTQTRIAFYEVLVAEEQLRLQESTVQRLEENLEENRGRQRAGVLDEYDVTQVEVQLSNEQPELTRARYEVDRAYRELKMELGIPLSVDFGVEGDLSEFDILSDSIESEENKNLKEIDQKTPFSHGQLTEAVSSATDLRGDLRILEKQQELQDRQIMAVRSRFFPTLSATYDLNWTASESGTPEFFGTEESRARAQTVALNLSIPIFQGFQRSSELAKAKIEKRDLEEQMHETLRSAENDIRSASESLNQAIESAPARQRAMEQAREGYERALSRFENGLISQLEVTNAEFQLREAELNYAQMVYEYLAAKAQYDQAVGKVPFVDDERPQLK